jgi:hypothetical protein
MILACLLSRPTLPRGHLLGLPRTFHGTGDIAELPWQRLTPDLCSRAEEITQRIRVISDHNRVGRSLLPRPIVNEITFVNGIKGYFLLRDSDAEAAMTEDGDDAGHCCSGLSARNYRGATAGDRAINRKWMLVMVVFPSFPHR